ncbi:Mediator of RNA polymerase II transcription subunit 14 [Vitis vinifera]|uniref:Mediator of RNA polymerase II transcription subunit 14 n=1 Tax=Vitis vinifera TaxID=29760 RepID=A0A438DRR2_VITVI|nr:Mediator of RNA polymerase II transcription subunit 14 [Vitis vinifera]
MLGLTSSAAKGAFFSVTENKATKTEQNGNGRFLLQSSRNILTPSTLSDCEEALNQGSMTAAEVFISLRSKSILHLFASIGSFLGLEWSAAGEGTLEIQKCFDVIIPWHNL